jgi:hypothetical protein
VVRLLGLLLLVILWSCDGPPTVPPIPTPTPTPVPTPKPEPTYRLRPLYAPCCDDPSTPEDEGYARGWPVATPDHIAEVAEWSQGAVIGFVFRTGPYADGIGGEYPRYIKDGNSFIFPDWTRLREAIIIANSYGMQGVIDVVDGWAIKDRRHNPLGLNCDATKSRPPEMYLEHARQVVEATADLAVIYETGNELWLCNPSREWEQAIVDIIKTHAPNAPIGSNARSGVAVDYLASHGWVGEFEPPLPNGGHWTESDQRILKVEDVDLFVDLWETRQITTTIWPGTTSNADLKLILEALVEVE